MSFYVSTGFIDWPLEDRAAGSPAIDKNAVGAQTMFAPNSGDKRWLDQHFMRFVRAHEYGLTEVE